MFLNGEVIFLIIRDGSGTEGSTDTEGGYKPQLCEFGITSFRQLWGSCEDVTLLRCNYFCAECPQRNWVGFLMIFVYIH